MKHKRDNKNGIRQELINKRNKLSNKFIDNSSRIIMSKLLKINEINDFQNKNIGIYFSKDNEVLTKEIISNFLEVGKRIFLPKIVNNVIKFSEIKDFDDLEPGNFNIMEPKPHCNITGDNEIDLLIIPCVCVDKHGNRIGRGAGFYDRFLINFKCVKVCLAYDFQVVDKIEVSDYDQKIDMIITEKRIIQTKLINGKEISTNILVKLKQRIIDQGIKAKLCVILVGNNPGSEIYVKHKQKKCESVGIDFELIRFGDDERNVSENDLISKIKELNNNSSVTGILVQLPLPKYINVDNVINIIDPDKDVDGLTDSSMTKLAQGDETLACPTAKGIIRLLESIEINLKNKSIVVVGHGRLVGKPLVLMLKNRGFDPIVCDEYTKNINDKIVKADVLITATGVGHLIKKGNVKQDVIIIDAGITKLDNKVVGNVDFENVKQKASLITPVPGGVGPMTVTMLIENVVEVAKVNVEENRVFDLIEKEQNRLQTGIELIPSENYVSKDVLKALGSVLTNKYSEGYPKRRYYGGNEFIDQIEELAIERAKKLFGAEHVNVQPYSGSPANLAVYFAFLEIGDKIMGMKLTHGGHLSHGHFVNFSGKNYNFIQYGVDEKTELLDYDEIRKIAIKEKPKLIVSGATAYPRVIDFKKIQEIAEEVGAIHMADISHIAGLIVAGIHNSPFPFTDIVTTTTHKTLRGPRGAMIMCKEKYAKQIDKAIFPGMQGGPHNHATAAIAVALGEALEPDFKAYAEQIVKNSKALSDELINQGLRVVTNGTDNHLILIDLSGIGCTGKEAETALDEVNITVNKNTIPFDKRSPFNPSGIRIGTPAITTRGMKEQEMKLIGQMISKVVKNHDNQSVKYEIKQEVLELCQRFPLG